MEKTITATYRIQLNKEFTFSDALEQISYLKSLGISHIYSSPILQAKEGSTHGYDVVDHEKINPELGSIEEFKQFIHTIHDFEIFFILDIVPNHIYVGNVQNKWWRDVLKYGKQSLYADYFDINWHPSKQAFHGKVYLPLLDEPFGKALENQKIQLVYDSGEFFLQLADLLIPTDPKTADVILKPLLEECCKVFDPLSSNLQELMQLMNSENRAEQLKALLEKDPSMLAILSKKLMVFNGTKGVTETFLDLEKFLQSQHYRFVYWKVANEELNYRRFFDIHGYASLRMEKNEVFKEAHKTIFQFIEQGLVQGLRIDHIDGLYDPEEYLTRLKEATIPYVVVEKILLGKETLCKSWPAEGTVGYDFLNFVNNLFVYRQNRSSLLNIYSEFTGIKDLVCKQKYDSKLLILQTSLASELHLLAKKLNGIAVKSRYCCDFSESELKKALTDVIIYLPVYRTYIQPLQGKVKKEDRRYIVAAIAIAKRHNRQIDPQIFHFIKSLFLLEYYQEDQEYKELCSDFVMYFQQITGAVMAKGVEDTASYRYFPLASINEVGSNLSTFGITSEIFHSKNLERMSFFPHSLLASTTHDTKRGEDVRARINVLSEIPDQWQLCLKEWSLANQGFKVSVKDALAPDANEEYFIYQTLLGTWPFDGVDDFYVSRIQEYLVKSIKEAKIHQSWIDPNEEYSNAVKLFVSQIVKNKAFLASFLPLKDVVENMGMLNGLSQLLLKLTSPGIPDIYQGNEIWDFSLVDPDNRRPVDFLKRKELMDSLQNHQDIREYLHSPQDGRIKLFITKETLSFRQKQKQLFACGSYVPLKIYGEFSAHCVAFARILENKICLIVCGKFFTFFMKTFNEYKNPDIWKSCFLEIPKEAIGISFKNIYTQEVFYFTEQKTSLEKILLLMPFALLESF